MEESAKYLRKIFIPLEENFILYANIKATAVTRGLKILYFYVVHRDQYASEWRVAKKEIKTDFSCKS